MCPLEAFRPEPRMSGEEPADGPHPRFHAHIYYDPEEVGRAKARAAEGKRRSGLSIGHFHLRPVGPHPRGSVQMTVPTDRFGEVATWLSVNRDGRKVFAHASTGDDRRDHSLNVVWFGPSEALDLSMFD